MQIKLYGNGHSCNIPVQEIIDKYWKDETAPFSFRKVKFPAWSL